jgi:hypothetical protein
MAETLCRIERVLGRTEVCPEERCPFWEPGGAVLEGRCAFERVDLDEDPEVATLLAQVRRTLESYPGPLEERKARHLFHRLLNQGQDE